MESKDMRKFQEVLNTRFLEHLRLTERITDLTDTISRTLVQTHEKDPFIPTALQFARISVDTPKIIVLCLQSGRIAHAYVLLRWYLEMAHLFYFLWQNPIEYRNWLNGTQIRPKSIGKYFQQMEFDTWQSSYDDWSNIVHGNHVAISTYHTIHARTAANVGQILIVGQAMINTMWSAHKFNYVLGKVLQPLIGKEYEMIATKYNELQDMIIALTDEQKNNERELMGGTGDKGV